MDFTSLCSSDRPLLVVVGHTASGKTDFSIDLCHTLLRKYGRVAEVVNADSRQLYRYLDIGTAKITHEEMEGVKHHMLDVLLPHEEVTAGWYQREAQNVIQSIHNRGNIPVVVGGSMLYVSTLIDHLTLAPKTHDALRSQLEEEYAFDQGTSLYARLQIIDPIAAKSIHPHNMPYVVRAMEIAILTDSSKTNAVRSNERGASRHHHPLYTMNILGKRLPREEAVVKMNNRVRAMFDAGWIDEVQSLLEKGYTQEDPAMKSHGYKEIMGYLLSSKSESLEDLQERIAVKTRQYARRQMTWWKRDQRIHWV